MSSPYRSKKRFLIVGQKRQRARMNDDAGILARRRSLHLDFARQRRRQRQSGGENQFRKRFRLRYGGTIVSPPGTPEKRGS